MKPIAIICDLDGTLCTDYDCPIEAGCEILRSLDDIQVHYVTARPEASRRSTIDFLDRYRLPFRANLYFCPDSVSTLRHKTEAMKRIARDRAVLVSVGDSDEDKRASLAAGLLFVRISHESPEDGWRRVRQLLISGP
jgi:phosphoglycolate phosphatase-like HAD superfamily hydrolase